MRKYILYRYGSYYPAPEQKIKGTCADGAVFNFKGDYFGLTESDVQKNIDLYGYNIYTKKSSRERDSTRAR